MECIEKKEKEKKRAWVDGSAQNESDEEEKKIQIVFLPYNSHAHVPAVPRIFFFILFRFFFISPPPPLEKKNDIFPLLLNYLTVVKNGNLQEIIAGISEK